MTMIGGRMRSGRAFRVRYFESLIVAVADGFTEARVTSRGSGVWTADP
jgi:hypothetical protein